MAKKQTDPGLKLNVSWEEAAEKLLRVPAGKTPPRATTPRKTAKKKTAKK